MTVIKDIWVDDTGTIFRGVLTDGNDIVDIQAALTKTIVFEKPDGTTMEKTATFTTDGTDGKLEYAVTTGDLDQAGVWRYYAKITYSGGSRRTSEAEFTVWE